MTLSVSRISSAFFVSIAAVFAQDSKILDFNRHGWVSYSGDHAVKGQWGVHFDAQWRRSDGFFTWQQYQVRPGVNYRVNPNLLLTLGYAYTRAYPYGDFPVASAFPEHRIYQQALIRQPLNGLTLSHRIRMEQRFIDYPNTTSTTYQNRFRYMLRGEIPITEKPAEGSATWYFPVWDEILIGIPPNEGARPFDQNRLFVGIGRSFEVANVEVGYMNQFLGQRNGRIFEFNNTLFVTVTSNYSLSSLFD